MAPPRTCVCECSSGDRNELPLVACRMQGQLQDAMRLVVPRLAIGAGRALKLTKAVPSSADDELSDAAYRIGFAGRRLWRESLVDVIVSA